MIKCVQTVKLFNSPKKNRRRNPKEWQDELETAKAFCRPPQPFLYDTPFYPFFPPTPIANQKWPIVNFDLNYQ